MARSPRSQDCPKPSTVFLRRGPGVGGPESWRVILTMSNLQNKEGIRVEPSCCLIYTHVPVRGLKHFAYICFLSFSHPCSTGLLWHEDTLTSIPNSYKPPPADWFYTASEEDSKPRSFICLLSCTLLIKKYFHLHTTPNILLLQVLVL